MVHQIRRMRRSYVITRMLISNVQNTTASETKTKTPRIPTKITTQSRTTKLKLQGQRERAIAPLRHTVGHLVCDPCAHQFGRTQGTGTGTYHTDSE
jgi:hypothetical protein